MSMAAPLARAILRAAERNTGLLYRMTTTLDATGEPPWRPVTTTHVEFGDTFPHAQPGDHVLTAADVKLEEPDAWAYLQGGAA